ncbi:PP0621 family protein [Roseateles sp.]|uniref:PP0621 family protein n=1 Tax=Roseateles sp. TaxID=1971397 RepID=UPI003BA83046
MKYLLLILLLALVFFILGMKRARPPLDKGGQVRARADQASQDGVHSLTMVTCSHCGLHLPRDEALPGKGGVFCGPAHRAAFEKAHPVEVDVERRRGS